MVDLDADGVLDIVVPNTDSSLVSIVRGIDGESWCDPVAIAELDAWFPYMISRGDLNGDGQPDFVIADYDDRKVHAVLSAP